MIFVNNKTSNLARNFFIAVLLLAILAPLPISAANPCVIKDASGQRTGDIAACVTQVYKWSIGVAAILAVLMSVLGGYKVMVSAGNAETASEGKDMIFSAVVGLALLFASYLILRTINPELVNFKSGYCTSEYLSNPVDASTRADCEAKGGRWELFDFRNVEINTNPRQ